MRNPENSNRRSLYSLLFLLLALCLGLSTSVDTRPAAASAPGPQVPSSGPQREGYDADEESYDYSVSWKRVDQLKDEQKFAAAADLVEEILDRAQAAGDEEEWTRALIRSVQLRTALHGYETAVRFLQERPWPESAVHRTVLELFYAQGLVTYLQAYSWEVTQRERVESEDEIDLRRWTQDQILEEAHAAFLRVWQMRDQWGDQGLGSLSEYLSQNNYPPRIRGTLRDTVTYLWTDLLANQAFWSPRHSNQVYRLDRDQLVEPDTAIDLDMALDDSAQHPLQKSAVLLADLERWHVRADRPEAAFEARLMRLRVLHQVLDQEIDRAALRRDLQDSLESLGRRYEWWAMGQAALAEFVEQESAPDALIRARDLALEGAEVHPDSVGGQRCRHLVASIEAPAFEVTAMQSDGPERRSILIRHKNLDVIHFRAYRLDLLEVIEDSQDHNLLPAHREVPEIINRQLPMAEWSTPLPATVDFRMHQTFSTPSLLEPGLYVVVGSARRSFRPANNRLVAVNIVIGDLVLLTRNSTEGAEIEVRSGATGRSLQGVDVLLYRFDYRRGHKRVASGQTDASGRVNFDGPGRSHDRYFVVARLGDDIGIDPNALWRLMSRERGPVSTALIYTDRSIYRPRQKILWKVVGFQMDGEGGGAVQPERSLQVDLVDANHQVVASRQVETNAFGSASGSFPVPDGRLLGQWHLRTSLGGQTQIRVEEYKRPTFEVSILEPESPLRLNRPVELRGEVGYYFGLPVVEGSVSWQVERQPVYPRGWWFWRPAAAAPEVIASGQGSTDAEGQFVLTFLPGADERLATSEGLSYTFRLHVDVVDDGGETRSASQTFRLGFVAVQASIETTASYFLAGNPAGLEIRRTDLDGVPRSGLGEWELCALAQPPQTLLPADQPLPQPADEDSRRFSVPGDALRTRWAAGYDPEQVLGLWEIDRCLQTDQATHDGEGLAAVDLGALDPGAYRLLYRTEDDYGASFETTKDFLVAAEGGRPVALPSLLLVERPSVSVGETARLLIQSGLADQDLTLEIYRDGQRIRREHYDADAGTRIVEMPIGPEQRGGFGVRLTAVRDHQLMTFDRRVFVPWSDRELAVSFSSFRDLLRPGTRESWRVEVKGWQGEVLSSGAAEILAYMYDRSLDIFAPHQPARIPALYPSRFGTGTLRANLASRGPVWWSGSGFRGLPGYPNLVGDHLIFFDGYSIGGPGRRGLYSKSEVAYSMSPQRVGGAVEEAAMMERLDVVSEGNGPAEPESKAGEELEANGDALRSDFSETAFWEPHLLLGEDGAVAFEFTVPDSVTEWNVWVHALSRDLRGGSLHETTRSAKDLLVRPYLPRFLREGDRAELQVVVNNASEGRLAGQLDFDILDPQSGDSLLPEFGLEREAAHSVPFAVEAGASSALTFHLLVPARVGEVTVEVRGQAGPWSDGERRALPLLPGRMHLSQSRFAALKGGARRELHFEDMAADDDPTRLHEQLVVTLDAQLFYGVLQALPYLARFPYECTEQTLNRFVSTGIVTSLYDSYPAVARMAKEFAKRDTQFEAWDGVDANRKMALVETPWLRSAQGGTADRDDLLNVLDPRSAEAERRAALAKLRKTQTSLGGFPWWPGGPPSPYMTLYLLQGFSRAMEFGIEISQDIVIRAWNYMHQHYIDELVQKMMQHDCCWEMVTFLNYVLSSYPDEAWTGGVFTDQERREMLDFSFRHWRRHSPLLKSYLALTLARADRGEDATLVFQSVMDSAKTTEDEGTFWAPEERSWLWYNDTIETHAFALRTLSEIEPTDQRRHGLVHWLFLNKKLNHWKSTRATAEVIYSLVHYLDQEGQLGQREAATVQIGSRVETFKFEADRYTGAKNQVLVAGEELEPRSDSTIIVESQTPALMFASATWHFSTEELPAEARGDFFSVNRRFFRRMATAEGWVLRPLQEGDPLEIGDQVEVQLSLRTRHAAEYVHLRDPRGAGFEPVTVASSYKWDLGIGWYEEIRDSGTNFFFDWLPVGEYTFKYRLRVAMTGEFKVAPAVLQSMYAPEFTAYSSGAALRVGH